MSSHPPRVICDRCLKDVDVVAVGGPNIGLLQLSCHGRVDLIDRSYDRAELKGNVVVWSEIKHIFVDDVALDRSEAYALSSALEAIQKLVVIHGVKLNHERPITEIPREDLDRAIDTLLLFRKDS